MAETKANPPSVEQSVLFFGATIFVSAFLLFQVQPIIAKIILPWFGGSAAVWTTCMVFFQLTLLAGYLYSHWSATRLPARSQTLLHGLLLLASLLCLPIKPDADWRPLGAENPTLRILAVLTMSVGFPFFLLSTTGPLLQAWFARIRPSGTPYRLYALSNLGSLLALLSYPVFVEPALTTRRQATVWAFGYGLFAVLCFLVSVRSARKDAPCGPPEAKAVASPLRRGTKLFWFALPTCASVLFLAVTNFLTQDVAAVPFLWILPLSIYLLSFVLCFDAPHWYRRTPYMVFLFLSVAATLAALYGIFRLGLLSILLVLSAMVFFGCMVCHGELVRLKPEFSGLTAYYLMLSLGGAAGGLTVGLAAPYLFSSNLELYLALAACTVAASAILQWDPASSFYYRNDSPRVPIILVVTAALLVGVFYRSSILAGSPRVMRRNFYGSLTVRDDLRAGTRTLSHGTTIHGLQLLAQADETQPTTYFCNDSGVGQALDLTKTRVRRNIGIVGLGAGTLAAYGREGDLIRFYEINPLVVELARSEFSYLSGTKARIEIVHGDARLSMEGESPQQYDVLVVDAFSGDSIPVHLLTTEAFQLYFRHMAVDGILAVHVSNRYLELSPLVGKVASVLGRKGFLIESQADKSRHCTAAQWVLIGNSGVLKTATKPNSMKPLSDGPELAPWTDDFSNLFSVLR